MPLWWTLWILSWGSAYSDPFSRVFSVIDLVFDALDVPLGIVVIALVSKLHAWQSEKHRRVVSAAT